VVYVTARVGLISISLDSSPRSHTLAVFFQTPRFVRAIIRALIFTSYALSGLFSLPNDCHQTGNDRTSHASCQRRPLICPLSRDVSIKVFDFVPPMDVVTISEDKIGQSSGKGFCESVSMYIIIEHICCKFVDPFFLTLISSINQPYLYSAKCIYTRIAPPVMQTGVSISLLIPSSPFNRVHVDKVQLAMRSIPFAIVVDIFGRYAHCCSWLSFASSQRSRTATRRQIIRFTCLPLKGPNSYFYRCLEIV